MVYKAIRLNPFPGLRPFELGEEHLFFGREGQIDELLIRLNRTRFLAILGASSSGKSSLVRAGLLPALYSGFLPNASSSWRVALMRPGSNPISSLARALNETSVFGVDIGDGFQTTFTETTLRRGALGLIEVVEQARMPADESLLIVVDQFEELFRFKYSATKLLSSFNDDAAAFVKLLLEAIRQTTLPIYVVITMRSDFLGDCIVFRDLPQALNNSIFVISRMTRDQRRNAIKGPVAISGAQISTRLVNRFLNDMGENLDQLSMFQHALMRTWDYWNDHHEYDEPIDLRHYEAIGGMAYALSQHADEIYESLPDDYAREITEKLFKALTEKGADNRGIRRPIKLGEIFAVTGALPEEVIDVVDAFRGPGRSFIMPPIGVELTESTVLDISHESLMRVWKRLRYWVEQEAQSAQIYLRLADTARLHQEDRAAFLKDPELTIAQNWREENQPNAVWAERYDSAFESTMQFLDASFSARDAENLTMEAFQRRTLRQLNYLRVFSLIMLILLGATIAFSMLQCRVPSSQETLIPSRRECP